jgi:hypothetical protein
MKMVRENLAVLQRMKEQELESTWVAKCRSFFRNSWALNQIRLTVKNKKSCQNATLGNNKNLTQPESRHMPASWRFVLNFGFEFRIFENKRIRDIIILNIKPTVKNKCSNQTVLKR